MAENVKKKVMFKLILKQLFRVELLPIEIDKMADSSFSCDDY